MTRLIWGPTVPEQVNWQTAADNCAAWGMRLPSLEEFSTARNHGLYHLDRQYPCVGDREWFFWTSDQGLYVSLQNGFTGRFPPLIKYLCVRNDGPSTPVDPGSGIIPDPVSGALPPTDFTLTDFDLILRQSTLVEKAISKRAVAPCKVSVAGRGRGFLNATTRDYMINLNIEQHGTTAATAHVISAHDAAAASAQKIISEMQAAGSLCSFYTEEQIQQHTVGFINQTVGITAQSAQYMKQQIDQSDGTTEPLEGKLNPPSIIVTGDEVVVVQPVHPETQKKIVNQSREPVPHQAVTAIDRNTTPFIRRNVFGDEATLGMELISQVQLPTVQQLSTWAQAQANVLFFNTQSILLNAWAMATPGANNVIRLTGQIQIASLDGLKTIKSIDETRNGSFEMPEIRILNNVNIVQFPPACTGTPAGPACIEAKIAGSIGVKPYGVKLIGNSAYDFIAYFRPYARIDLDAFGGLEHVVSHAGIRGRVSLLDGTFALLGGKLYPDEDSECIRAEIDELRILDGKIYADIETDALGPTMSGLKAQVGALCETAEEMGSQIVSIEKAIRDGVADLPREFLNTTKQAADQIVAGGKDLIDDAAKLVSTPSLSVPTKLPWSYRERSDQRWLTPSVKLPKISCDEVLEKVDRFQKIRQLYEIYNWRGVRFERHHKWFEACQNIQ